MKTICLHCGSELPNENKLGYHYFWSDCVTYLKAEIACLQSEARWTNCIDKLPEYIPNKPPELLEIVTDNSVYYSPVVLTIDGYWNHNNGEYWHELDISVSASKWRKLTTPQMED
jgi:hypothetical protein